VESACVLCYFVRVLGWVVTASRAAQGPHEAACQKHESCAP
jgi:hypothetical protein